MLVVSVNQTSNFKSDYACIFRYHLCILEKYYDSDQQNYLCVQKKP